jgi:Major Facilitator Superfamily
MLGVSFVTMLVALDQTVVGTALPTIVAELKGFDLYAWVATSYWLTSVITVPIFGRLGDYYGRKPFVIASIIRNDRRVDSRGDRGGDGRGGLRRLAVPARAAGQNQARARAGRLG